MNVFVRVIVVCLAVAVLLPGIFANAADGNMAALTQESQKILQTADHVILAWWLPEEYWKSIFEQTQTAPSQSEEFLKVVRPYFILVVVDGTAGALGGMTYKSEDWIRSNVRLIDSNGVGYTPKNEDEIDPDAGNLLLTFKPIFANMLGKMGENMHILLFPAMTSDGVPIAEATKTGHFKVEVGDTEFVWHLPLDTLLPGKYCPKCKRDGKGSWTFCPWCGKQLSKKQ